jgi:hypothetical protein
MIVCLKGLSNKIGHRLQVGTVLRVSVANERSHFSDLELSLGCFVVLIFGSNGKNR